MNKTILVVDDEVSMTRMISLILGKKGYQVVTSTDSHLVESMLREHTIDLFILDYMMPGLNGVELCHMLRSRPETTETPIFILSALSDNQVIIDCRRAGANDYFTKDELAGRLIDAVEAQLYPQLNGH